MVWFLLTLQIATGAALVALYWRTRPHSPSRQLSEDEADAEAFLATTVERLLRELQDSADRATTGLSEQRRALEALLSQADARMARLPQGSGAGELPAAGPRAEWTQHVVELAASGLPPLQIAKQVGRGETEVRLALAGSAGGGRG